MPPEANTCGRVTPQNRRESKRGERKHVREPVAV